MDFEKFYLLLVGVVDVPVYPDVIPESGEIPAVSYVHIGQSKTRIKTGMRSGEFDSWRVSITGNTLDEILYIYNQIDALDNQSAGGYSRIYTTYSSIESKQEGTELRQAFIDLDTYGLTSTLNV